MSQNTMYELGRVGLKLRGDYNAATAYEKLDVVSYNGSCYAAKAACTGVAPTNEQSWMLLAEGTGPITSSNDTYRLGIQAGLTDVLTIPAKQVTEVTITFPKPFLSGTVPICVPVYYTASTGLTMAELSVVSYAPSNTQFLARCINNSTSGRAPRISWIAVGIPDPANVD